MFKALKALSSKLKPANSHSQSRLGSQIAPFWVTEMTMPTGTSVEAPRGGGWVCACQYIQLLQHLQCQSPGDSDTCANMRAAGLAVSMVITLQIYCGVSEFFHLLKHVFEGFWRLLDRRYEVTYSPTCPKPFQLSLKFIWGQGGMELSVFIPWHLTWLHILLVSTSSVQMSWEK